VASILVCLTPKRKIPYIHIRFSIDREPVRPLRLYALRRGRYVPDANAMSK
jgi:hypothetical protein